MTNTDQGPLTIGREPGPTKHWQAEVMWRNGTPITEQDQVQRAVAELIDDGNELGIEVLDAETGTWLIEIYDAKMAQLILENPAVPLGEVTLESDEYIVAIPLA